MKKYLIEKMESGDYFQSDIPSDDAEGERVDKKGINQNHGRICNGDLVCIGIDSQIHRLRKRFSQIQFKKDNDIVASNGLIGVVRNAGSFSLSLPSISLPPSSLSSLSLSLPPLSLPSHIFKFGRNIFIVDQEKLIYVRDNFIFRNVRIPLISNMRPYITFLQDKIYLLGKVSHFFEKLKPGSHFISLIDNNGEFEKILPFTGEWRGVCHDDNRIYVTGNFQGQLSLGDKKIGPFMKNKTSFILCLERDLSLSWYRFLVSCDPCAPMIGDILFEGGFLYTTFRFSGGVGLSEINSEDIQIKRDGCEKGMMILRLKDNNVLWRFFPLSYDKRDNYVRLFSKGNDIIVCGHSASPLKNAPGVRDNIFLLLINLDLFESSYVFFSGIQIEDIGLSGEQIIMRVNIEERDVLTYPFGVYCLEERGQYIIEISLSYPNLIGVYSRGNVVFHGRVDMDNLIPSMEYYINECGCLSLKTGERYFGTALSRNVLYIK